MAADTLAQFIRQIDAGNRLGAGALAELPTMTLGQISTRLGFSVTSDFLSSIGFEAHREKAAKLYRPSDFGAICAGISKHVLALAAERQAA